MVSFFPVSLFCPMSFLITSSSKARISRDHIFLSPDFHELWHSVMSTCLITEVKQEWTTLVLGWVTSSVQYAVSDSFAACASRPKPLSALFFSVGLLAIDSLLHYQDLVTSCGESVGL